MNPIQESVMSIYIELQKIFTTANVRYFVAYGTAIGTVRHKGFIPWDDDFDLAMPRKDFEKFLKYIDDPQNELENLRIISPRKSGYPFLYAKVFKKDQQTNYVDSTNGLSGLFIDIFPLDNVRNLKFMEHCRFNAITLINHVVLTKTTNGTFNKKWDLLAPITAPLSLLGVNKLKRLEQWLCTRSSDDDNGMYLNYGGPYKFGSDVYLEDEIKEVTLKQFETISVPIPVGVDSLLTRIYGDYMKLPDVAERKNSHFKDDNND